MQNNIVPQGNHNADSPITNKKQWLFMALFLVIAVLSVTTVVNQSRNFSFSDFINYVQNASVGWLICAFVCMLGFIIFEGLAIIVLCKAFGYGKTFRQGFIYSASDIYFSAITPSATGGQPASAYFMMKDGMNGMMATTILVANLAMYTLSIVVIGFVCFVFGFDIFLKYSVPSKILIVIGFVVQIGLLVFFYMLLRCENLLQKICNWCLGLLCKLKIIRKREQKQAKLDAYLDKYRKYAKALIGKSKPLILCFVFNFIQRILQIAVTMFSYASTTGKGLAESFELLFWQGYVTLGANCVPVPGAMGVSDHMMLDGFSNIMTESQAVNLELLSRTVSFYSCVILCGIAVLIKYLMIKFKERKKC